MTAMADAAAASTPKSPAFIRRYRPGDFDDVSRVCLLTADAGGDATGLFSSDDLMPDVYVRPYVLLESRFAWVVESRGAARGYIVCAPDTRAFVARYREEWLPRFVREHDGVEGFDGEERKLRGAGVTPERMLSPEVDAYPAHLHIDLLPELQGQGWGRRLMQTLVAALSAEGVAGVHLSLAASNTGARAFYDRTGFVELSSSTAESPTLGLRIS